MFQIRRESKVEPEERVLISASYWKCGLCGRSIQKQMSKADHNLISHRFGEVGRR